MPDLLTLDEAKAKLSAAAEVLGGSENLRLDESLGRRLSVAIKAPMDLPPFASSAMDGYAFKAMTGHEEYRQVGEALAGKPYQGSLAEGECVRIFTGAMLPDQVDTVIAQENTQASGAQVRCLDPALPGQHVRPAGLDVGVGEALARQGDLVTPTLLGLLASAGLTEVACSTRIRVTLLTTGDELVTPPDRLPEGCIYESNLAMLQALLDSGSVEINSVLKLPDDQAEIERALRVAAKTSDVIISTGGISVGDTDYVAKIMQAEGQLDFWRIALRPGMPMAFGKFASTVFFGLPGNPVSTVVTLVELVNPFITLMAGGTITPNLRIRAKLAEPLQKTTKRTEFQRGIFSCAKDGEVRVASTGDQTSNRISSLTKANCFIVLDGEAQTYAADETVLIQPFGF